MQVQPAGKPNPEIKVGPDFSTEIMFLGKFLAIPRPFFFFNKQL